MRAPRHIAGHGQQVTVHVDGDLVRAAGRIAARRTLMEVRDLIDHTLTEVALILAERVREAERRGAVEALREAAYDIGEGEGISRFVGMDPLDAAVRAEKRASRNEALKMLGNGVVPQQCAMALRIMLGRTGAVAA